MFDFVRSHNRLLQIGLGVLIIPTFGFFGISSYMQSNEQSVAVASVDGHEISRADWETQHRKDIDQIRARNPQVDLKLLDTPEAQRQSLDTLVRDRVMQAAVAREGLAVSDDRIKHEYLTNPQFDQLRQFTKEQRDAILAQQGLTGNALFDNIGQGLARAQAGVVQQGDHRRLVRHARHPVAALRHQGLRRRDRAHRRRGRCVLQGPRRRLRRARAGQDRVPAAGRRGAAIAGQGRPDAGAGVLRRQQVALHHGRRAPCEPHPDQRRAQRVGRRRGQGQGAGRERAGRGAQGSGGLRRHREEELAGRRLRGARRRPRLHAQGRHPRPVQRHAVRDEGRRDQRRRAQRRRLPHHQDDGFARRQRQVVRRSEAADRSRPMPRSSPTPSTNNPTASTPRPRRSS
jgi:hypothetical protein